MDALEYLRALGRDIGLAGILVLILFGGFQQWWIWGWHYREVMKDRDEWKALALQKRSRKRNDILTKKEK